MHLNRYLFRVYYDGIFYNGFQRQPNGNGVENHIEMAFIKANLINSFGENGYQSVSRTDTGVSGIGNIFSLHCSEQPNLKRINANLPKNRSIQIWSFAPIQLEFRVRPPVSKLYGYCFTKDDFNKIKVLDRIYDFIGNHNFKPLIKGDGAGLYNSSSKIFDIFLEEMNNKVFIFIKGDKFGREQIRRMIGFITDPRYHNVTVKKLIAGLESIHIKPASPIPLILVNIKYEKHLYWQGKLKNLNLNNFDHYSLVKREALF